MEVLLLDHEEEDLVGVRSRCREGAESVQCERTEPAADAKSEMLGGGKSRI